MRYQRSENDLKLKYENLREVKGVSELGFYPSLVEIWGNLRIVRDDSTYNLTKR